MRKFLGIGHSHLHCVTAALREFARQTPNSIEYTPMCLFDPPFAPSFAHEKGGLIPNPHLLEALREHISGGDVTVFLCWGGSEYWRWSLSPGPQPFDFVDPIEDDGEPLIGEPMPYELFMRKARWSFSLIKNITDVVRGISTVPVIGFLPPPPAFDLTAAVGPDQMKMIEETEPWGLSPAHFRLKVWRATNRAIASVCAEAGVECPKTPREAADEAGYFRPEMIGDALHGNIGWGRLLARNLLSEEVQLERAL